jgi:hypothetical protein
MVDTPISSSDATSVALRPTRSPKWPSRAEPTGRATKAMAKVAKESSSCAASDSCGKNTGPNTRAAAVP